MRQRIRRPCLALIAALSLALPASDAGAQSATGQFIVRGVDFEIHGISLEFVMRNKVGIEAGRRFATRAELDAYVEERKQRLVNERVLASVEAIYSLVEEDDGDYSVFITFTTYDTWNIVALPYFKYDSNKGLLLSARARDYNFLGSMRRLELNLDYRRDEEARESFVGTTSFSLPFRILGSEWTAAFSEELQLWSDGTSPRSVGTASLGLILPSVKIPVRVTLSQGISLNAEGPDPDPDPWFLSSVLSADADVDVGLGFGYWGTLTYTPNIFISENWRPGVELLYAGRGGLALGFGHRLSFGRVDWVGNMRNGLSASASNANSYNVDLDSLVGDVDLAFNGYVHWKNRIGAALRILLFERFLGSDREEQGQFLRGILDARVRASDGAFVNLSFPIKLLDFPFHALIRRDWLDFELQVSPFLDAAVAVSGGDALGTDSLWSSAGLEAYVYPKALRSFIVRASFGVDLRSFIEKPDLSAPSSRDGASPYEIFFGLGLMY